MFSAMAKRRNCYLHNNVHGSIDPCVINRNVTQAMNQPLILYDKSQPFQINVALQPITFAPRVDYRRAELAYGSWGIPQLIRQLNDTNAKIRSKALTTLNEELHNPEKCYTAFKKYHIVTRLAEVLVDLTVADIDTIFEYSLERTILNFAILSTHLEIAMEIYYHPIVIHILFSLIIDLDAISFQSAKVLATMTCHQMVAENLLRTEILSTIMDVLKHITMIPDLFITLANLSERNPKQAVKLKYLEFLFQFLNTNHSCEAEIIKCFAIIAQCSEAQTICDKLDCVPALLCTLKNPESNNSTLEYACMALHNCLLSTRSRWRAREFYDLPLILITHAHNKSSQRLQMHSLQALVHIIEMPSVMNFVRRVCKKKIKAICCDTESVRIYKETILAKLRHNVFRHDSTKGTKTQSKLVVCRPSEIYVSQVHRKPFTYRTDVRIPTPIVSRSSIDTNVLIEQSKNGKTDDENDSMISIWMCTKMNTNLRQ